MGAGEGGLGEAGGHGVAAVTNCHKLRARNNTSVLYYGFGGQEFKICLTGKKLMCRQGWILLEALGENLSLAVSSF